MTPIEFLENLQLEQTPPRVRNVSIYNEYHRLAFPWVSIGAFKYYQVGRVAVRNPWVYRSVYAFFHNEPWTSLEHALTVLRAPPIVFNATAFGSVCVGDAALALLQRKLTPAEAFWFTNSNKRSAGVLPNAMGDIAHPNRVLLVNWPEISVVDQLGVSHSGFPALMNHYARGMKRDGFALWFEKDTPLFEEGEMP